jgi:hypothetical protein
MRWKKKRMKRLATRSLAYWGILVIEATSKIKEDYPEDGFHLQILHKMLPSTLHDNCTAVHPSTEAAPPPSLSIQHEGGASCGGQSPVNRRTAGIPVWLNFKCMTTLYNCIKRG